jgi:hypothetical protein
MIRTNSFLAELRVYSRNLDNGASLVGLRTGNSRNPPPGPNLVITPVARDRCGAWAGIVMVLVVHRWWRRPISSVRYADGPVPVAPGPQALYLAQRGISLGSDGEVGYRKAACGLASPGCLNPFQAATRRASGPANEARQDARVGRAWAQRARQQWRGATRGSCMMIIAMFSVGSGLVLNVAVNSSICQADMPAAIELSEAFRGTLIAASTARWRRVKIWKSWSKYPSAERISVLRPWLAIDLRAMSSF